LSVIGERGFMTCTEFEKYLPDIIDGAVETNDATHIKECPACAELVSDLKAICTEARSLDSSFEPSPRVWANIQRTLEAEGLIRPVLQPGGVLAGNRRRSLAAWLVPLTALVVLGVGALVYTNRPAPIPVADSSVVPTLKPAPTLSATSVDTDDEQLLAQVSPAARAAYADNLKSVNAFIEDAREDVKQHPSDDDARQFLLEAYEQKEAVYDLAMNHATQ
jgi:hypothetical protein